MLWLMWSVTYDLIIPVAILKKWASYLRLIPNLDKPEPKRFSDSLAKITRKSEIRI